MFFIGEALLVLDIKAKYPFAPSPTRQACCEQNNNTIFFTSEKGRIANQNADTKNTFDGASKQCTRISRKANS